MSNEVQLTPNRSVDRIVGYLIAACFVVGLLGNVFALLYFWKDRTRSLPHKLYVSIVTVDIVICFLCVPLMTFLFNERNTAFCSHDVISGIFLVVSRITIKMSIFLVTVLSITRTVAIVKPHRVQEIRPVAVATVIIGYAVFLTIVDLVPLSLGWVIPETAHNIGACAILKKTTKAPIQAVRFLFVANESAIILPSIAVILSFILGVTVLRRSNSKTGLTSNMDTEKRTRKVSTTIILFTALFLMCNVPLIATSALVMVCYFSPTISSQVMQYRLNNTWYRWYGIILFGYFPVILNAALNPCLYLMRMPRYREELSQQSDSATRRISGVFITLSEARDSYRTRTRSKISSVGLKPISEMDEILESPV